MDPTQIELHLLPKLRFIGFILLGFSVIAFVFSFFPEQFDEAQLLIEEEITSPLSLNTYTISAAFAFVGSSCIWIAWRRKNGFKEKNSDR